MVERLGEMRKGRRERIERERNFEPPPYLEFSRSDPAM